jgi:hypothetical protein
MGLLNERGAGLVEESKERQRDGIGGLTLRLRFSSMLIILPRTYNNQAPFAEYFMVQMDNNVWFNIW